MRRSRLIAIVVAGAGLTSIIWVPALALAATGQVDKFNYYVKALEYGLKGLIEYFNFIVELFKVAVAR
ncbi:MAG: hypothetical protein DRJ67_05140 [Thermoprotei archaeon]|nr:MAG: hypothetical protein DRJ67_05140 [Thermoprotei archaeon]